MAAGSLTFSKKDNNRTLLIIEIEDMLRSIQENRCNKKWLMD